MIYSQVRTFTMELGNPACAIILEKNFWTCILESLAASLLLIAHIGNVKKNVGVEPWAAPIGLPLAGEARLHLHASNNRLFTPETSQSMLIQGARYCMSWDTDGLQDQ